MIYNTKIIDYGDYLHIQWYDHHLIRSEVSEEMQAGINQAEKQEIINDLHAPEQKEDDPEKQEHSLKTSVNRSKNNLYRIARSNEWELFITITFDRKITDSSDYKIVSNKITSFLNNLRKRGSENLKYLIVPELHKDGKHYHFHGLLSGADSLILEDSGHKDRYGATIYNILNWKIGFTTAQKIKNQSAVRNYIGKYITKELMNKIKYKKRYFASKNCYVAPEEYYQFSIDEIYSMFGDRIAYAKTQTINGINRIKYLEVKKDID